MELHEAISILKRLYKELERPPLWHEAHRAGISQYFIKIHTFSKLLKMADIKPLEREFEATPKIGILDLEIAPTQAYVWNMFDENISRKQIIKEWHILSYAIGNLDNDDILYYDKRKDKDDLKLVKKLAKDIEKFDIIITFNGKNFDKKKFMARLAFYDLPPVGEFFHIDIFRDIKKVFKLSMNNLDYVSRYFKLINIKSDHKKFGGFELFTECLLGNNEAWAELELYNKQDVIVTKELYLRVRKYIRGYNPNVFSEKLRLMCECGSFHIKKDGFAYTTKARKQRFKCVDCGHKFVGKENLIGKDKRKLIF